MNPRIPLAIAGLLAALLLPVHAAGDKTDKTTEPAISRKEAKDLKAQSEADYKSRKNVVDAQAEQEKADCKASLDGSAKRACKSSVKHHAKGAKAEAKMVHEAEEKAIRDAKK